MEGDGRYPMESILIHGACDGAKGMPTLHPRYIDARILSWKRYPWRSDALGMPF